MRILLAFFAVAALTAKAQQTFTLQQILSAPYATSLTAAPTGPLFAWVEDAEGRHNLFVGGANIPARQLTHNTEDDAQDIAGLAWSPDASTIAYVYGAETGNSGRPANPAHLQHATAVEIYLQPTAGGTPIKLGEGRAPFFTPDGNSVLFLRSGQIFIADLHCMATKDCHLEPCEPPVGDCHSARSEGPASPPAAAQLPSHPLLYDRGTASSLTLSPDGKLLAYISHRRNHSFLALFNFATKELTFPEPSTGNDAAPIFSRDGKHLAWLRYPFTTAPEFATNRTSPNPWSIQILDVATHTTRTLFTPDPNKPGSAEPRMSTGEPRLLFTATNQVLFFSEADGWVHLYSIDPSSTKPPAKLTSGGEVEDALISRDGTRVIYSSTGPSSTCVADKCFRTFVPPEYPDIRTLWTQVIDPAQRTFANNGPLTPTDVIATHPVELSDGTIVGLVSSSTQPMHPALISSAPASPGIWDRAPAPKDIRTSNPPASYPATSLIRPEKVIFPSSDNLFQLHGQLFVPKSPATPTTKHPAILFFHGGPKRQMLLGYPAMDYYSNAYAFNQYLASRGYIVLSVNYRGGIGYGLNFRQCEHCGADGAAEYADALGAAAYLRSRPDVDTAHIGIWGGSYGGYFVALALARNSDIFAAGVDFHGVHEWAREDNAAADWLRGSLTDQEKIAALAHASSPMADIDKWRSPILLIHGDDDPDVAYSQTPILADALRARSVHVEELIFPDELHGFLLHRNWLAAYQAAADFFDRTLKSANQTTPLK